MSLNLKGIKIKVHDMSLRDGMHPKRHQITSEQMKSIAQGLDQAGCPLIEVTHGDGLGGASVNYGFPACTPTRSTCDCGDAAHQAAPRFPCPADSGHGHR